MPVEFSPGRITSSNIWEYPACSDRPGEYNPPPITLDTMMIRILIERRIAQGLEHYYDGTVKRTISQVGRAPGCIAGESLKDTQDPSRRIIMSKWESVEDWQNWLHSLERKNVVSELAPLLDGNERITMLEHTH